QRAEPTVRPGPALTGTADPAHRTAGPVPRPGGLLPTPGTAAGVRQLRPAGTTVAAAAGLRDRIRGVRGRRPAVQQPEEELSARHRRAGARRARRDPLHRVLRAQRPGDRRAGADERWLDPG